MIAATRTFIMRNSLIGEAQKMRRRYYCREATAEGRSRTAAPASSFFRPFRLHFDLCERPEATKTPDLTHCKARSHQLAKERFRRIMSPGRSPSPVRSVLTYRYVLLWHRVAHKVPF